MKQKKDEEERTAFQSSVMPEHIELSIIVPCFNEAACIGKLYHELSNVLDTHRLTAEMIFVDDGSSDDSLKLITALLHNDARVRYISFSRNFGHQKALEAGLHKAAGKAMVTMDADMQHPPFVIPQLVRKWKEGYEIVNAVRQSGDNRCWFKDVTSRLFYKCINSLSDTRIKAGGADFRLMDRKVVEVLKQCREEYFFLRGLTSWCGFRSCEVAYEEPKRLAGKSKYTFMKMVSFALCGITSFSIKPLRLAIFMAGIFVLFSLLEVFYVLYVMLFTHDSVSGWASLAILISLLGASILFTLGIIGEYLGKLFIESKKRPEYIIKEEK